VTSLRSFVAACCLAVAVCAASASIARADVKRVLDGERTMHAEPLTNADVEQFMDWFAVRDIFPGLIAKVVDENGAADAFSAAQRACVVEVVSPALHDAMRAQFRGMLGDRATFLAWSDLMETSAGRRFVAFLQGSMKAEFLGGPAPSQDGLFDGLTDEDRAAMVRFTRSNALQALQSAPDFDLDPQTEQRLRKEARKRCGVTI
jgi:hypothetical protein